MPVKLAVQDLRKAYGANEAVSGVSFEVAAGEVFGLLGPNGAGKTTTIETIVGLTDPDVGTISIAGVDPAQDPIEAKRRIGVALQSTGLQDKITPKEALRTFGAFYPDPVPTELLLERFGLVEKADARFDTLSGGQRQRLALALAFVNDPEIVFLDEPTVGLDPQMRRELHNRILAMKAENRAVLLATHDMDEAEQLCDRIAVIDRGRLLAEGTPEELIARSRATLRVSADLSASVGTDWAAGLPYIAEAAEEGRTFRFATSDLTQSLGALANYVAAAGASILSLDARKASLEDVILELTGTPSRD